MTWILNGANYYRLLNILLRPSGFILNHSYLLAIRICYAIKVAFFHKIELILLINSLISSGTWAMQFLFHLIFFFLTCVCVMDEASLLSFLLLQVQVAVDISFTRECGRYIFLCYTIHCILMYVQENLQIHR